MKRVVALDTLLAARQVWRGKPQPPPAAPCPSGWNALDAALPSGGWPPGALTELLLPADGTGELRLLWPTLARLSRQPGAGVIALVAPPYLPYPPAWAAAGVHLPQLQLVRCEARDALWAAEQCLRSAACAAVLCWPHQADDRALRRLQVAAETGQCLGFALRPVTAAANPSPAALRIAIDIQPSQLRVLKCRGGNPPARPIPFPCSNPDPSCGRGFSPDPTCPEPTRSTLRAGAEAPPTVDAPPTTGEPPPAAKAGGRVIRFPSPSAAG